MSDYISDLRQDLVEAAARQQQRSPAVRAARPLHPRNWSPLAVVGAATALAAVLVVVIGLRAIEPVPRPTDAQVVTTIHVGGQPRDVVAVGGSLLIADEDGRLYKVPTTDPGARTRLDLAGKAPLSLAVAGDAVWVVVSDPPSPTTDSSGPPDLWLVKLDPRSGRRVEQVRLDDVGDAVRAGAVGVWLPLYVGLRTQGLNPGKPHGIELGELVAADGSCGPAAATTVVQLDPRGRILRRVPDLAEPVEFAGTGTILPDARGAWVLGQAGGELTRIEGGRITRRVKVGRSAGVLARVGPDIWVSVIAGPGDYQLVRVAGGSGRITGRVRLGRTAPQVIVPAGEQLWVVTSGGEAVLVNPHG